MRKYMYQNQSYYKEIVHIWKTYASSSSGDWLKGHSFNWLVFNIQKTLETSSVIWTMTGW